MPAFSGPMARESGIRHSQIGPGISSNSRFPWGIMGDVFDRFHDPPWRCGNPVRILDAAPPGFPRAGDRSQIQLHWIPSQARESMAGLNPRRELGFYLISDSSPIPGDTGSARPASSICVLEGPLSPGARWRTPVILRWKTHRPRQSGPLGIKSHRRQHTSRTRGHGEELRRKLHAGRALVDKGYPNTLSQGELPPVPVPRFRWRGSPGRTPAASPARFIERNAPSAS